MRKAINWLEEVETPSPVGLAPLGQTGGSYTTTTIPMIGLDFYEVLAPTSLGLPPEEAESACSQRTGLWHNLNALAVAIGRHPHDARRRGLEEKLRNFQARSRTTDLPEIEAIRLETEALLTEIGGNLASEQRENHRRRTRQPEVFHM